MARHPSPVPVRPRWRRLLQAGLRAWLTACGLTAGAQAQPPADAPVIDRLDSIRQRLLAQDASTGQAALTDAPTDAQADAPAEADAEVGQWFNWPNWANWSKWANWNNWNNWGKL
ncbi:hypothetical protein AACH10_08700 [Ideonella sp. DXS22W]|uniref:Uncharacterized protein n=1 Tax=Pseudaquabacterium inlustre TaxID=2984192 RepID=A0ABU9CIE8_9BURK